MAAIHPSRMRLIQPDLRQTSRDYDRPRSPPSRDNNDRRRFRSRSRSRSRERGRNNYYPDRPSRRDEDDRDAPPHMNGNSDRNGRESRYDSADRNSGRQSPEYGDYSKPPPPPPNRNSHGYGGRGGTDFMESRRIQRENATVNVWPPSPKGPTRGLSPLRKKKSKRSRSSSTSSSSSSEEERRRRKRKEKKRARKERDRDDKKERRRHRSRSRSRPRRRSRTVDSEEDYRSKRRSRSRSRSKSYKRNPSPKRSRSLSEDDWVEKDAVVTPPVPLPSASNQPLTNDYTSESEDDGVGPRPMAAPKARKIDERAYGGALLRGEGSAMAAFLQDGGTGARIPRRGEIGMSSNEIAKFEDAGYVMSGSRHRRMNAVRMRKENQVINAEEKRSILKLQKEEMERREAILREEFSELVHESLKTGGMDKASDA